MNNHTCVCSYNSFVQYLEFGCLMAERKPTFLQASQGQLQIGSVYPLVPLCRLKESSTLIVWKSLVLYLGTFALCAPESIRSGTHFVPGQGDAGGGPFSQPKTLQEPRAFSGAYRSARSLLTLVDVGKNV